MKKVLLALSTALFALIFVFSLSASFVNAATSSPVLNLSIYSLDNINKDDVSDTLKLVKNFIEKNSPLRLDYSITSSGSSHTLTSWSCDGNKSGCVTFNFSDTPSKIQTQIKDSNNINGLGFFYKLNGKTPLQAGSTYGPNMGASTNSGKIGYFSIPTDIWWYNNDPYQGFSTRSSQIATHETINIIQSTVEDLYGCQINYQPTAQENDNAYMYEKDRLDLISKKCQDALDKSFTPQTKLPITAKVKDKGTLNLVYDKTNKESLLLGKQSVSVTAGDLDIYITQEPFLTVLNSKDVSYYINDSKIDTTVTNAKRVITKDGGNGWLIMAGQTATFNSSISVIPGNMFAGKYYVKFNNGINWYSKISSGTYDIEPINSDLVAIVGEKGDSSKPTSADVYTLSVSPKQTSPGSPVVLTWSAPASRKSHPTDWVGFYKSGDSDKKFISWKYTKGLATGTFSASSQAVGAYEFRYFLDDGYTKVATTSLAVNATPVVNPAIGQCYSTGANDWPACCDVNSDAKAKSLWKNKASAWTKRAYSCSEYPGYKMTSSSTITPPALNTISSTEGAGTQSTKTEITPQTAVTTPVVPTTPAVIPPVPATVSTVGQCYSTTANDWPACCNVNNDAKAKSLWQDKTGSWTKRGYSCSEYPGYTMTPSTTIIPPPINTVSSLDNAVINVALKRGDEGQQVSALQSALKQIGLYSGEITGFFGDLTKKSVMSFQKANTLDAVGEVGPKTRDLLNFILSR